MGRFSRLDWDERPGRPLAHAGDPWPNMDAAGCMKAAQNELDSGLYEDALSSFSRTLRFDREQADAWLGQARCLIYLDEFPEAETWCNRALERFRNSPDLLAAKGLALIGKGEHTVGMEFLDGGVESKGATWWVWLARGEGLLYTGAMVENAWHCFQKAAELDPRVWEAELRGGAALNRGRHYARARILLNSALRQAPENPLALLHLGIAAEGLGDMAGAAGFYERASLNRKNFHEALDGLHRVSSVGPLTRWLKKMIRR